VEASFDLLAASLRADTQDLRAFVEALAAKLSGAFPDRVRVDRSGLLGNKRVKALSVDLGDERYELEHDDGHVSCRCSSVVRGITLKSRELELDSWIDALSQELLEEAGRSERGRVALERLLAE
jgi:hypothetical protein